MFALDLLHEIELGVWKGLFTHLLWILYAAGGDTIVALNSRYVQFLPNIIYLFMPYRYHQIPTFGCDTIWKFANNALGMKKLAARYFEDLLQVLELTLCASFQLLTSLKCTVPVFKGLLPEVHNKIVMNLLFKLMMWYIFSSQALTPYWINCSGTWDINHLAWYCFPQVYIYHMWSLCNEGSSFWGSSARSTPGCPCPKKGDKWKETTDNKPFRWHSRTLCCCC